MFKLTIKYPLNENQQKEELNKIFKKQSQTSCVCVILVVNHGEIQTPLHSVTLKHNGVKQLLNQG